MDTPKSDKTHVEADVVDVHKALKDAGALSAATSVAPSLHNFDTYSDEKGRAALLADVDDLPPDGGRGWLVIFGCVIYSAATVGWGLFMTLLSVIPGKLADRYGYRPFLAAGGILWTLSMLACTFSTELWHFFVVMGPIQGIANALVFPLIVALPSQWFLRYRALATGIVVAGSSIGGAVSSLVFRALLSTLGLRKAFAIYTAIDGVLLLAAWFMISERRVPGQRKQIVWFDVGFFRDPVFWSLGLCFFFTVFGYLSPIFFLPTFAQDKLLSLSPLLAALPVTMLNFSAATGRTLVGFAADRIGPVNALWGVIMLSGLTQLLVWSFVSTYAGIMAFGILYGFVCGCFLSLSPAVSSQLYGSSRLAGLSGLMLLFNLPGNSAGAPLGGAILSATGGNWLAVSVYSGSLQIVGASVLLYARFKREPKIFAKY